MRHFRPLRLSALTTALIAGPVALFTAVPGSAVTGTPPTTPPPPLPPSCFADNPTQSLAVPAR